MKNHTVVLEHKCWSNEQYSKREYLEISGISSDTAAGELEETVLNIFEKLDVDVDLKNVEDFHWFKNRNCSKKVIIKLSKNTSIQESLNSLNLESMGISSPIFIRNTLYTYYKKLWDKCKKLRVNKYTHWFWILCGLIKIKMSEVNHQLQSHMMLIWRTSLRKPTVKDNSEDCDNSNKS